MALKRTSSGTLLFADYGKSVLAGSDNCCVKCLDGRSLEISISLMSNGLCSHCSIYDQTYLLGPLQFNSANCCVMLSGATLNPPTGSTDCTYAGGSPMPWPWVVGDPLHIGKSTTIPNDWWISFVAHFSGSGVGSNSEAAWDLSGAAALDGIHTLCSGATLSVPLVAQWDNGITPRSLSCASTTGTGGAANNTVGRTCIVTQPLQVVLV